MIEYKIEQSNSTKPKIFLDDLNEIIKQSQFPDKKLYP
jgi:hypothetical protein